MKSVLISIKPKWCELIASGNKTIEIRKTKPKLDVPFKVYIYESSGNQRVGNENFNVILKGKGRKKVIGEFVCDNLEMLFDTNGNSANYMTEILPDILKRTALTYKEFQVYVNGRASKNSIYGWHISNLKIYDKPKELSEFYRECEQPDCDDCPYLHFENTPNSYEGWCEYDEKIPIKRPPQSWCYVESGE